MLRKQIKVKLQAHSPILGSGYKVKSITNAIVLDRPLTGMAREIRVGSNLDEREAKILAEVKRVDVTTLCH
jgi:hypothetical protein